MFKLLINELWNLEQMLKLTCNLSNRAFIQHHLSNPLLVNLDFIYVNHLCKSTGFQAPCSL